MHIEFESLGGIFNCPTRFTDIVKRAGWESGIKMIPAINNVITMLQSTGKLGREDITASMSDRLQSDDGDVVYRFCPGNEGYQLITYHIFEENITKVRIFKRDTEEYSPEVFEWDNQRYR